MKERPILFSAPMVRALLDGSKTQTRRIANPQPKDGFAIESIPVLGRITSPHKKRGKFGLFIRRGLDTDFPETDIITCPYGQPSDRLWVREAWRTYASVDDLRPLDISPGAIIQYEALGTNIYGDKGDCLLGMGKYRPSMFMPHWASRITLEITNVRVERLQDISYDDAKVEGWNPIAHDGKNPAPLDPISWYRKLWKSINGPSSWDSNPWVWVIEFKKINQETL